MSVGGINSELKLLPTLRDSELTGLEAGAKQLILAASTGISNEQVDMIIIKH